MLVARLAPTSSFRGSLRRPRNLGTERRSSARDPSVALGSLGMTRRSSRRASTRATNMRTTLEVISRYHQVPDAGVRVLHQLCPPPVHVVAGDLQVVDPG